MLLTEKRSQQRILNKTHKNFIDDALAANKKLTSHKLKQILANRWLELRNIPIANIKRCHKMIGWVATRPQYSQLI